jgi:hypothetical protein
MLRVLVLQTLHSLSDDQTEYQLRDGGILADWEPARGRQIDRGGRRPNATADLVPAAHGAVIPAVNEESDHAHRHRIGSGAAPATSRPRCRRALYQPMGRPAG